ncbi:MFS transporter [Aspergillus steynii IBT 23096]|uniref:MFS transporter n=1 Tax=Aspergillus steynii IBT 23096 TaxID=1392250 RepID=A0A2I2FU92_9EURO|nr:MFS transporter [Aspergillus steynii IBT 23096]PLB44157.1 MFS transporter [Aspergillus steynii IBT 23096]
MSRGADAKQLAGQSEVIRLLEADTVPWYKKPNLRFLYFCLVPAALGVEMTTGYDGSVLNGLQAVPSWQTYFGSPDGALLGVLNASYNLGGLITLPIVPYVNDRFGRKHSITFGSIILVIGVILQSASQNIGMFLASRLILGTGIPFAVSGASQLLAELTYPRERAVITGLFNTSWFIGAIMAAGVTLGTHTMPNDWGWRIPSILQASPSVLQLIFIWFIPESPRWLLSKDRGEEAFEVLVKYHAEGDRNSEFVNAEFREISTQLKMEIENSKSRWIELLLTPGNRKRTLIATCVGVFTQWSGNGLVSYYLAKVLTTVGVTDKKTQNIINLSLSCWFWLCATGSAFMTSFLARRTQYLTSFVGMFICFSVWTGVSAGYAQHASHASGTAVVAMIFLYNAMYSIMQPLTYTYVTEVFPFVHRAKGLAILQFFTRGSTAFNSFVNPIGIDDLGWKFYLVYVAWLVVETTIIFFLYPETKGPTLEEIAHIFDGPNAVIGKTGLDEEEDVSHIEPVAQAKPR